MAHWAEIDENSIVLRVLVTSNDDIDEGYQWLIDNLGGTWIKTSYNSYGGVHYQNELDENAQRVLSGKPHLRYNYAGVGFIYDPIRDAFISPKPSDTWELPDGTVGTYKGNWVLNEETCLWELIPIDSE
jgi:hypothetical protein